MELPNVTLVDLSYNQLTSLARATSATVMMPKLRRLIVTDNALTALDPWLATQPALFHL